MRKIVAALEKIGLHPKVTALPQAISGHRIDVDIGEEKPGNTRTNLIIHIGAAEKVRQVYKASEDWAKGTLRVGYGSEPVSVPQWTGLVIFATDSPNYHEESRKLGAETYASAESLGGCIKRDVMLTVIINRFDTQTWTQFRQSTNIKTPTTSAETDAYIKRTTALSVREAYSFPSGSSRKRKTGSRSSPRSSTM